MRRKGAKQKNKPEFSAKQVAVLLGYELGGLPVVDTVAKGHQTKGILREARRYGIPQVRTKLASKLEKLQEREVIPYDLYEEVAGILVKHYEF